MKKYAESMGHMTFRRYMDISNFRYCRSSKQWIKDEAKASQNREPTEWKPVKRLENFQKNLMVLFHEYLNRLNHDSAVKFTSDYIQDEHWNRFGAITYRNRKPVPRIRRGLKIVLKYDWLIRLWRRHL